MFAATAIVWLAIGQTAQRPVPPRAERVEAEIEILLLFRSDYHRAMSGGEADKKALGRQLLQWSTQVRDDEAAHYVMLRRSQQMAAWALDFHVAMAITRQIIREYQPDGPDAPDRQIALAREMEDQLDGIASRPWRLAKKFEVAEWYFRAQPKMQFLDRALIQKRLDEMWARQYSPCP